MEVLNGFYIAFSIMVSLFGAGHALLYKRDSRAALGWVAMCLVFPLIGPLLYFLFGINRVQTLAKKLDQRTPFYIGVEENPGQEKFANIKSLVQVPPEFSDLKRISDTMARWPLVGGNRARALFNGEAAYPEMIRAIDEARDFVFLSTYIFDTNRSGQAFLNALSRACQRGLDVRVLLDGVGEFYSFPRAGRRLRKQGIRFARFLPPKVVPPSVHINLRNHRKVLIVDGQVGFTGGMNIGDRHLAQNLQNPSRVIDVQFRLEGPVVRQMELAFLEDWGFCTGEYTPPSSGPVAYAGNAICRAIVDGPNEYLNKLAAIMAAAITYARRNVFVMTPYFLPTQELIAAMRNAALRGVEVNVLLPARNNLPYVQWACNNMLRDLLPWGVRLYFQPPPFVHSKLFVVDDFYAMIGSANLDPRSLRLNFELNVEIFDRHIAAVLVEHMETCRACSLRATMEGLDRRSFAAKMRDAALWLFSPYL